MAKDVTESQRPASIVPHTMRMLMYRQMKERSLSLGALAAASVICALCLLLVSGAEQALGAKVRTFVEECLNPVLEVLICHYDLEFPFLPNQR